MLEISENLHLSGRYLGSFSEDSTILMVIIFTLVGMSAIVNLITSCITKSSYQSVYSSFNFIQLLLLIPLTGIDVPTKISAIFHSMRPSLLSFYFLECNDVSINSSDFGECGYSQTNSGLNFIGLEQGSTIINTHLATVALITVLVTHLIFLPIYYCIMKTDSDGCFAKMIIGIINMLTFTFYIRFFIEIYLLLCLSTISEVKKFKTGSSTQTRSLITAFIVILIYLSFMIFSFIHWLKYSQIEDLSKSKFHHLYSGFKSTKWPRIFNVIFMARRILLSLFLILLYDQDRLIRICILAGLQMSYFIILVIFRPYKSKKDNILEFINEFGFLVITCAFIYLHKLSNWKTILDWGIWMFIIAILFTFLVTSLVFMISAFYYRNKDIVIDIKPTAKEKSQASFKLTEPKKLTPVMKDDSEVDNDIKTSRGRHLESTKTIPQSSKHITPGEAYHNYAKDAFMGKAGDKSGDALHSRNGGIYNFKKYPIHREQESSKNIRNQDHRF